MGRTLFIAALFFISTNMALADTQACLQAFDKTPGKLGAWPKIQTTNYEKKHPGAGYSARYGNNKQWLTVFLFDDKKSKVDQHLVRGHFSLAIGDVMNAARARKAKLAKFSAVQIPDTRAGLSYYGETTSSDGRTEIVAMGHIKGCMIKLRMTTRKKPKPTAKAFWQLAEHANRAFKAK